MDPEVCIVFVTMGAEARIVDFIRSNFEVGQEGDRRWCRTGKAARLENEPENGDCVQVWLNNWLGKFGR
jgi:hypothetical protein